MTGKEQEVAALMTRVIKLVVDRPDKVKVQVISTSVATVLRYFASPEDARKLSGSQNHILVCLKSLTLSLSGSTGKKFSLEIVPRRNPVDSLK